MNEKDKELIIEWFEYISQIADDRKTASGMVMPDWAALDEIKVKAKEAAEYIKSFLMTKKVWHTSDEPIEDGKEVLIELRYSEDKYHHVGMYYKDIEVVNIDEIGHLPIADCDRWAYMDDIVKLT